MANTLTEKQNRFCKEYMVDLNATQAAIRAGYKPSSARAQAATMLTKQNILDRIAELKARAEQKIDLRAQEVLEELKRFAYSDITDTMGLTEEQIKELPAEVRRLIVSYRKKEYTTKAGDTTVTYDIKFIDKMKAFDMLNRHIGFYEADNLQQAESKEARVNISIDGKDVNLSA